MLALLLKPIDFIILQNQEIQETLKHAICDNKKYMHQITY